MYNTAQNSRYASTINQLMKLSPLIKSRYCSTELLK